MRAPDHHTSKLGSKDFVFQVNKWPFSITCNPLLPKTTESFIDLALVKDMKIPMKKVECRKISYGGYDTKLVGSISQTVQVVYDGVANGTMHLKAKVIRHLSNLYGVDCIAGQNLYRILTRSESLADLDAVSEAVTEQSQNETDDNASAFNSADEFIYNDQDSPKTRKRKRRNRFMVANLSFTSSMKSSPPSSPGANSPKTAQVQISKSNLTSSSPGKALPERYPPDPAQQRQDHPPPPPQNPLLHELIFCGHHYPCTCVDNLRTQQLRILPPHYPVYLPIGHHPCGLDCGSHHVHGDNLHPPDPRLCPCDPPRLYPILVQNLPSHHHAVHDRPVLHDVPPLPPDFMPCGHACGYQLCQCLRQYEGRDWAS